MIQNRRNHYPGAPTTNDGRGGAADHPSVGWRADVRSTQPAARPARHPELHGGGQLGGVQRCGLPSSHDDDGAGRQSRVPGQVRPQRAVLDGQGQRPEARARLRARRE